MFRIRIRISRLALGVLLTALISSAAPASGPTALASASAAQAATGRSGSSPATKPPGGPLSRANVTPLPPSRLITGARWISGRYDPPANQWGDILPTVWSEDGGTYVLMDDGGVDVPLAGGLWRQSLAHVLGSPPNLRFQYVGNPSAPPPHTWGQIGNDPDNDDGPLGPYYSIGFAEAAGVFYATQQRDWNWSANGPFTGLVGIAYSTNRGKTWAFPEISFPAPLGNLTFVDGGGPGGAYPPDGYMYAIGSEREFNASTLLLGRVRPGIATVTNPAAWQWFAGYRTGARGKRIAQWSSSVASAVPVLNWSSHITYPEMTYDAPLHRYLLTFTYSYSSQVPAVWTGGAELVIAESSSPSGPFSFVAASHDFGPSNGYGAGFPSQWISANGRQLWLKWAANFDGCATGLDCSGKYGFNLAEVQLTVAAKAPAKTKSKAGNAAPAPKHDRKTRVRVLAVVSGVSLPLLLMLFFDDRRTGRRLRRRR